MERDTNLSDSGNRIERLLGEIQAMVSNPAWQRVDELMRLVLQLHGAGLSRIIELLQLGGTVSDLRDRLLEDELINSLLILHGLHPHSLEGRVSEALDKVRPYLGSHGGDVELIGIDQSAGVVKLRLGGSCDGCPSSMVTVKLAVETAVKELAPEISIVEVEGIASAGANHLPDESVTTRAHAHGR